jgi:hypothetical protein
MNYMFILIFIFCFIFWILNMNVCIVAMNIYIITQEHYTILFKYK